MPLYEFKCPSCNVIQEVLQKFEDEAPICCGKKCDRVISNTGRPIFKGTGFYETDYKNN